MVDPLVDPAQKGRPNYIWAGRNLALLIRGPSPLQKHRHRLYRQSCNGFYMV